MGWFLFFCLIFLGVALFLSAVSAGNAQQAKQSAMIEGKKDAVAYVGSDGSYLSLDFEARTMSLGRKQGGIELPFSDIMTVEVIENGSTLTRTNRGSQALGAAVGALAFGGVGAVIGGLSGSQTSTTDLHGLILRIHVMSRILPTQDIEFLRSYGKKGWDRHGLVGRTSLEGVNRFHSLVLQAMRLAEEGPAERQAFVPPSSIEPDPMPEPMVDIATPITVEPSPANLSVSDAERRYARIARG